MCSSQWLNVRHQRTNCSHEGKYRKVSRCWNTRDTSQSTRISCECPLWYGKELILYHPIWFCIAHRLADVASCVCSSRVSGDSGPRHDGLQSRGPRWHQRRRCDVLEPCRWSPLFACRISSSNSPFCATFPVIIQKHLYHTNLDGHDQGNLTIKIEYKYLVTNQLLTLCTLMPCCGVFIM